MPPNRKHKNVIRDQVFISYSHNDRNDWLQPLLKMLAPLIRNGSIKLWSDQDITVGQHWRDAIDDALAATKVAVLLVSHEFLASDFIVNHEIPYFLDAQKQGLLDIVWIPVGASLVKETDLGRIQAASDPSQPLNTMPKPLALQELSRISLEVQKLMNA